MIMCRDIRAGQEISEAIAEIRKLSSPTWTQTGTASPPARPFLVGRLFTGGFCADGCARPDIQEAHRFLPSMTGVSFAT
jgi:hypothetical protein